MRAHLLIAGLGAAAVTALLATSPQAHAAATRNAAHTQAADTVATSAPGPAGTLSSDVEALGVRVEYDIPLPAGTGTVPHVAGDTSRQNSEDNSHGLAGAPSQLDAVVGGQYVDPNGEGGGKPQRNLPQTECFSPGHNLDTVFRFPTDTQAETAALPPISVATAQCAPGPYVEMHASVTGIGLRGTPSEALGAVVHSGTATADGLSRAVHGQLVSDGAAHVSDLDILGAIHIGGVTVSGHSAVTGKAGGAETSGSVALTDMTIGGVTASLTNGALSVAGQSAPVDTSAGQALLGQLNTALAPSGCTATVMAKPSDYPQGFLLARKPPEIGAAADGHLAASMEGGMLFVCNLPASVTSQLGGFSPQRVQVLVGFAFTSTQAISDPGGFGLGDLGGLTGTSAGTAVTGPGTITSTPVLHGLVPAPPPTTIVSSTEPAVTTAPAARSTALAAPVLRVGHYAFDPTLRAVLFALCLIGWLALTGVGIRALRGVTAG